MANTYIQLELLTESKGMLTYFKTQSLKKPHKRLRMPIDVLRRFFASETDGLTVRLVIVGYS